QGDWRVGYARQPGSAHGGAGEHAGNPQSRRLHALLLLSAASPGPASRLVQVGAVPLARRARSAWRPEGVRARAAGACKDPGLGFDGGGALSRRARAARRYGEAERGATGCSGDARFHDRRREGEGVNSMHDMGGMHGLGAVRAEPNEPPFHEKWEGRAGGIVEVMTFPENFPGDRFRYLRETLRPDLYLTQSYYEQWLYVAEQILLEAGMISAEELRDGRAGPGAAKRNDAMRADAVWGFLHDRAHTGRKLAEGPRFAIGQRVRARNMQPDGHTRLPRYARG